ncbi:MAG: N-acetylmuramic acid 6-phosphate etherase [Butyrivibrio sp.]|uniref:N-acetylmuramic acid 6-phosphate etherase n=1 Tax=Butyrivibrio sp. TaxID=28121 RepID=UPI001B10D17B|nr:N-acetylmuramic acid 6-phosphate etherase [Butyrivibrio sp.]MBO6242698.1 N-acetylmuramic acid 6-phosphate etherase [Butyrivibrio sp.]
MDLSNIATEQRNERTEHIDRLDTLEMVKLINSEDKQVAYAVEKVLPQVAEAIESAAERLKVGGRLIYVGCGTSGRLGILDAVECPPTFSTDPSMVLGLIAGGTTAIFSAVEGAEDSYELGAKDLEEKKLSDRDLVVGLAASGRTPYVIGAMKYARSIGCKVVGVTSCPGSEIDVLADIGIAPETGPEVITGSTRLKSGTAEKMILNMISTGTMIKLGKVYGNLMVDVKASNEKLVNRCETIVQMATGVTRQEATAVLEKCDYKPKVAIVMIKKGVEADKAQSILADAGGIISDALSE